MYTIIVEIKYKYGVIVRFPTEKLHIILCFYFWIMSMWEDVHMFFHWKCVQCTELCVASYDLWIKICKSKQLPGFRNTSEICHFMNCGLTFLSHHNIRAYKTHGVGILHENAATLQHFCENCLEENTFLGKKSFFN